MSDYEKFVKLHIKRDKLKEKLAKINADIEKSEEVMLKKMVDDGLASAKTPFGTLGINRIVRASAGGNMPALVDAMKRAGKEDMVKDTVNGTSLGAWVREFDPDNNLSPEQIERKLPKELQGVIKITEQTTIRVTGKKG